MLDRDGFAPAVPAGHAGGTRRGRATVLRAGRLVGCLLGIAVLASTSGCQTLRSWEQGCPGIYSGVRFYSEQVGELPFDGRVFFTADLLFTSIADTLSLPASAFADPEMPTGGYALGCRWATRRAIEGARHSGGR